MAAAPASISGGKLTATPPEVEELRNDERLAELRYPPTHWMLEELRLAELRARVNGEKPDG